MTSSSVTSVCIHNEGISKVCMDTNRQIVSVGNNSSVVFYDKSFDGDSYQFDISDTIQDIVCYHRDKYYVALATDKNAVLEYSYLSGNPNDDPFAESKLERRLMRFTAEVNCLDVSTDNIYLAAGASDFLIKVTNLDDIGNIIILEGHEAPVMCCQFSDKHLASSSCDGTVRIWSFKEKFQIISINVMPKANDLSLCVTLCRLSWQPKQGNTLAVPIGSTVALYDTNSWKLSHTLEDDYHQMSINVCRWSLCGRYLALGGADGHVSVWEYPSCIVSSRIDTDTNLISSLFWDPLGFDSAHPLLFSSSTGHIGSIPGHMMQQGSGNGSDTNKGSNIDKESNIDYNDPLIQDSLLMEGIPTDDIFDNDDDIMNASCTDIAPRKRPSSPNNEAPPTTKHRHRINYSDDDNDSLSTVTPLDTISTNQIAATTIQAPPIPIREYHEIFQPSATPTRLTHRFMVYNVVGTVCCHGDYDSIPMIEVEFHNTLTHHSFSINNDIGWSMAVLNKNGLVLAKEKDEDSQSQFQVTVFNSWDSDKDWSYSMPKGETIDVVAIGDDWVAIATDKLFIRIYTLGGVQREIISCPGQVITMSGCGSQLGVVYQETEVSLLSFWLLNMSRHKQVTDSHTLPLSPKAKLEWLGFSESGVPLSYDTKGIVRVLSLQYGRSSWLPVLNCQKELAVKGDHYFVVGMTHKPNLLRVILCKGLDYPPVQPRPVMTTLPLSLPLCDPNTEKSEIECQYLQKLFIHPLSTSNRPDTTELLEHLIEMIALACQSGHEYRGYELATMIENEEGLELALQYTNTSGHYKLAKHINSLLELRASKESEEYDYDDHTSNHSNSNYGNQLARRTIEPSSIRSDPSRNFLDKRQSKFSKGGNRMYQKSSKENMEISSDLQLEQEVTPIEEGSGEEDNGEDKDIGEREDNEEEQQDEEQENTDMNSSSINLFSSPRQPSSLTKTNPFKITTPVSKQIQMDRRSSFLDKLCKTVVEEEEKKKQKERNIKGDDNTLRKKKISSTRKRKVNNGSNNNTNPKLTPFLQLSKKQ